MPFLPTSIKEVRERGWDYIDVILFTGDAYIDHPSFGAAVVGRILEDEGLRVAVVPQPNWRDDLRDFRKLGKPRLFFAVTAGAMDSMVNHYTANLRLRSNDAFTPGGKAGFRPDNATIVYSRILKELYPTTPLLIGGIEASLRRHTHYDYWKDCLLPSILVPTGADFLVYGMGERVLRKIAEATRNGYNARLLRKLDQMAFLADDAYVDSLDQGRLFRLHSFEKCCEDPHALGENFVRIETECNRMAPDTTLAERCGNDWVVVNPMNSPLTTSELDHAFDLPYMRAPHPRYDGKGEIPAWEMIRNSVNIHRGCFGGCSFCTISAHQGKFISSRSEASILREVTELAKSEGFHGTISDAGGPSANMYGMHGSNLKACSACRRPSCLWPAMCPNLDNDHRPLMALYDRITAIKGVRHLFIGSGIRYDLFDDSGYFDKVVRHHTSGRLKVAPEHTEDGVLGLMRKPSFSLFEEIRARFDRICHASGLKYQIIPYFISSHPGCTLQDMMNLKRKVVGRMNFDLEQVQDFTPTPLTLSSVMFYTGIDPYTGHRVSVERSQEGKRRQKSMFFRDGMSHPRHAAKGNR